MLQKKNKNKSKQQKNKKTKTKQILAAKLGLVALNCEG